MRAFLIGILRRRVSLVTDFMYCTRSRLMSNNTNLLTHFLTYLLSYLLLLPTTTTTTTAAAAAAAAAAATVGVNT